MSPLWTANQKNTPRVWLQEPFAVVASCFCFWTLLMIRHLEGQSPPCVQNETFTVGVLVPLDGPKPMGKEMERTARHIFDKLNRECALNGYNLTYQLRNTDCDTGKGLYELVEVQRKGVKALVGPSCDSVCQPAGLLAARWNMAMVSFGCESTILSNRTKYPTFARTTGTYNEMGRFIQAILHRYDWNRGICIITIVKSSDVWLEMADELHRNFHKNITSTHWSAELNNEKTFITELRQQMEGSFVFLLCMFPKSIWKFLYLVKKNQLFVEGIVYISFDYVNLGKRMNWTIDKYYDFTGLLDITMDLDPDQSNFSNFLEQIQDSQFINDTSCLHYEYGLHAALMADAIYLLIEGLKTSTFYNISFINASDIIRSINNITFPGLTGEVHINVDGTRRSNFMLHSLVSGCYKPIARTAYITTEPWVMYDRIEDVSIWPGYSTNIPRCPQHICLKDSFEAWKLAVAVVVSISILLIIALIVLAVRRRQTLREMGRKDWIITSEKLYACPAFPGKSNVLDSMRSVSKLPSSQRALEEGNPNLSRDSLRTFVMGQIFAKVTVLDQQLVAVKQVNKQTMDLTKATIQEVNQIRRLKNSNVNQLVGACIEPGNISLVWVYCPKGSLRDLLQNESIKLDWMFKISFISDIAKGMTYLHSSPVQVHGRMKSTNVVIDNNWCCKVTDISMPHFRSGETNSDMDNWQKNFSLLWTAPEILRSGNESSTMATKKGDVYAFAIIMHEIITRGHPFGLQDENNPEDFILRIKFEEKPPFRPKLPDRNNANDNLGKIGDESILDLMVMCWDEYPQFRLSFHTISHNLKKMREIHGTSANLVDQMLQMVTKYADNLEDLVEERTQQLREEQDKTEELLCRMLPRSVAHELKMGNPVIPESYSSVTIFFSDIVGFTALAAKSTPMQVVTMLNELYTVFDNVVDRYDAYKIETIGDAYMVVSGLPVRNGDKHAGEIATVALEILTKVLSFKIPHVPTKQLFLRIGLHSGPTVAGVVGLKMPRFCLFGDTVNYASRMESSGKPLHIHISPECKHYLDILGGYHTKERGPVEIKGKGTINTFFLIGKESFNVKTPQLLPGVKEAVGINVFQ